MIVETRAFVALDVVSALLTLALVAFFVVSYARTRAPFHLLMAFGFFLVGVSFLVASASEFDLSREQGTWDAERLAGQTGGAFAILLAYVAARREDTRVGEALAWGALATLLAFVGFILLRPLSPEPSLRTTSAIAHGAQALAYAGAVVFAARSLRRAPRRDRALVPAGFALMGVAKLHWLALDLGASNGIVWFVYAARIAAVLLLLLALMLPSSDEGAE